MSFEEFSRRPKIKVPMENIARAAQTAGFQGEDVVLATAIAVAESDGHLDVYNGSCCYGLWQIHRLWNAQYPSAFTLSPINQARAALAIRNTPRGWKHWEVYTNAQNPATAVMRRSYLPYLSAARDAAAKVGAMDRKSLGESLILGMGVNEALDRFTSGKLWVRIGSALLGVVFLSAGIIMVGGELVLPKGIRKAAGNVKIARKMVQAVQPSGKPIPTIR